MTFVDLCNFFLVLVQNTIFDDYVKQITKVIKGTSR